jgi:hypothetical protein
MAGFSKRRFKGQLKTINARVGLTAPLTGPFDLPGILSMKRAVDALGGDTAKGLWRAVQGQRKFFPTKEEQVKAFNDAVRWLKGKNITAKPGAAKAIKSTAAAKGITSIKAIGTIGAGALAVAAWALPAKRLGEAIGIGIEERKAGRRLTGIKDVEVLTKKAGELVKPPVDVTAKLIRKRRGQKAAIKKRIRSLRTLKR